MQNEHDLASPARNMLVQAIRAAARTSDRASETRDLNAMADRISLGEAGYVPTWLALDAIRNALEGRA